MAEMLENHIERLEYEVEQLKGSEEQLKGEVFVKERVAKLEKAGYEKEVKLDKMERQNQLGVLELG